MPVARIKIIIYVLSSRDGVAGGFYPGRPLRQHSPRYRSGLELTVITITVLGGVSIFGGSGTMVGAVLALVLVGMLRFGMGLINLQGQVQDIVIGLLADPLDPAAAVGSKIQWQAAVAAGDPC